MANSKSNIYPIQLQGAELNLNKYDAEIKQYSGFNKNNSPFVGGCLSNVFHKNETIEDANDSNTYIDENGDVYRVTTEGLFKNSEVVFSFDENDTFFDCEEIDSHNAVFVYSDKIRLFRVDDKFKLNDSIAFTLAFDFQDCLDKGLFTGVFFDDYFVFVANTSAEGNYIMFLISAETGEILSSVTYTYSASININSDRPLKILIAENRIGVLFVYNNGYQYRMNIYTVGSEGELTLSHELVEYTDKNDTDLTYYYYSSYPVNVLHHRPYSEQGSFSSIGGIIARTNLELNGSGKLMITVDPLTVVNNSSTEQPYPTEDLGMFYISDVVTKDNNKYYFYHRVLDVLKGTSGFGPSENNPNSIMKATFKYGDSIDIGKFTFLFNNGYLTGIAGKDVLLTDWNIESKYVTYSYNNFVCYKEAEKWYKVSISETPRIIKNNQWLCINKNGVNAFNINKNIISQFAPSFNLNFLSPVTLQGYNKPDSLYGVSGTINEYEQNKLCSAIINPVTVYNFYFTLNNMFKPDKTYYNFVNCYYGFPEKVTYTQSYHGDVYIRRQDLIKLPFPNNTDGNIEYCPSLFSKIMSIFGSSSFIKVGSYYYPLRKDGNNEIIFAFYFASGIDNLELGFIIQGQFYGIINSGIYSIIYTNGVVSDISFIVDISNLQFVGNTPYEALFFSKTNRCLYSFTGANVLNQKQLVDKISEVRNYLYNPATQTVFLITDIGVLFYGLFGMFLLEYTDITNIFLLDNGIVMSDNSGNYRYIKYYLDEGDEGYTKENIRLETCFYGMNNEVVTINDCLYFRLFSEEHEEGNLKVSATTISLSGRKTEETTFKIKASDWDKITHTIYLRYQPKAQRGLGVSFSIDSPFKIASMSVGSQPDAVLVDRVSKGAITAPSVTTNNNEW